MNKCLKGSEELEDVKKPTDWPMNDNEAELETIMEYLEKFHTNPSFEIKEILISLCNVSTLNQHSSLGMARRKTSEYEIALLNTIYIYGGIFTFPSVKFFVLDYIYRTVRGRMTMIGMLHSIDDVKAREMYGSLDLSDYSGLLPQLLLFLEMTVEIKVGNFETLHSAFLGVSELMLETASEESKLIVAHAVVTLFRDLSDAVALTFMNISWNRDEIYDAFQLISRCLIVRNENPSIRPLRGLVCISLSNWILKSRHYNINQMTYKSIDANILKSAVPKNEIWLRSIENLNDEHEGKLLHQIFSNTDWIKTLWAKEIVLKNKPRTYVACFSKCEPNDELRQRYGGTVLGFKTDIIGESIVPIIDTYSNGNYRLGQYIYYDVTYSRSGFKDEINYLISIIDLFDIKDDEKLTILNSVIPYWYLSIKDEEWEEEEERRYEIYIGESKLKSAIEEYETINDEKVMFLKSRSALYAYPDFLNTKDNVLKNILLSRSNEKLSALYRHKDYYRCNECLYCNFDAIGLDDIHKCHLCGSEKIVKNKSRRFSKERKTKVKLI